MFYVPRKIDRHEHTERAVLSRSNVQTFIRSLLFKSVHKDADTDTKRDIAEQDFERF